VHRSRKPVKEAISKLWTVPVDTVRRSRKTDQRIHFQTVDISCGQVHKSRYTDQGKPIKESISKLDQGKSIKEAISKLWTVPVDPVHISRKADQGAQITGNPIKEAISKLWTFPVVKCKYQRNQIKLHRLRKTDQRSHFQTVDPVDPVHRSRKTDQRIHFQTVDSSCRPSAQIKVHRSQENRSKKPFPNFGQFL
jgi:ribosomal protein L23